MQQRDSRCLVVEGGCACLRVPAGCTAVLAVRPMHAGFWWLVVRLHGYRMRGKGCMAGAGGLLHLGRLPGLLWQGDCHGRLCHRRLPQVGGSRGL